MIIALFILGIVGAFSIPYFRGQQIRTDLDLVKEQVVQGMGRAKMLAQTGREDSAWGFYVPGGVLYKGTSYATRDPQFDEIYPMPSTIVVNGMLFEVSFSKLDGKPSASGSIILTGLDNEQRIISIKLYVGVEETMVGASASSLSDPVTFCHKPGMFNQQTMTQPLTSWAAHQAHGDTLGACGGGGGSVACTDTISLQTGGGISTLKKVDMKVTAMAKNLTYGAGGPDIPVTLLYTDDNGAHWKKVYQNTNDPIVAGTVKDVNNINNSSTVALQMHGSFSSAGWTTYDSTAETNSVAYPEKALILRDGDLVPSYFNNTELKNVFQNWNLLSADGLRVQFPGVPFNACGVIVITELSSVIVPPPESEDYTDAVLLLQFTPS